MQRGNMKVESKIETLTKKPANELSAKELNLVRRYQSYTRKLALLKQKEAKITRTISEAQEAHQQIASKQSKLVAKIAEVEQQCNAKLKAEKEEDDTKESKPVAATNGVTRKPAAAASKKSEAATGRA